MPWKKLLALVTGSIDEELRLRNEYLVTENPERHGCRRRFPGGNLIHDRDSKFCEHFNGLPRSMNIEPVKLPPRSPNLNPYAERFVLCLDRLILLGEKSLTYVLNEYITHYHLERNHQGIGNTLISPRPDSDKDRERDIKCQERLGGLLKFYYRPGA